MAKNVIASVKSANRYECDRARFRQYLLDGITAKPLGPMDATYFAALRQSLARQRQPSQ